MTKVYRAVDGDTVLPDRFFHGTPVNKYGLNISFSKNATIQDYANVGLYLEIGVKPAHNQYQKAVVTGAFANHTTKKVELQWSVVSLNPEHVAEIQRREGYEAEQTGLKGKTSDEAEAWIVARLQATTLDNKTKIELNKIFKKIVSFLIN